MGNYFRHNRLFALIFVLVLLTSSCNLAPKEEVLPDAPVIQEAKLKEYKKAEVIRGDIIDKVSVDCRYSAFQSEELAFGINGLRIYNVYVEEGDYVKAGDLLAELMMDDLKEQIEAYLDNIESINLKISNQADLRDFTLSALSELQEIEGFNEQLSSRYESEIANYEKTIAKLEEELYIKEKRLNLLYEDVEKRQIIAGIDGIVLDIVEYSDRDFSNKDKKFITVYNPDSMLFVTSGKNTDLFIPGDKVIISVADTKYSAVVIHPNELSDFDDLTPDSNVAYLRVLDEEGILQSNSKGIVTFVLKELKNVLYLPKSAVHRDKEKSYVYVEDEGGFKSVKEVETGLEADRKVEIISGLSEGDSVILD
ncbi:MAG: biotin/lipoyl-binding protein [Clostridiales bacterium]|nr:biotin/lipoyl-binding protein [Clostridiales bacterium]